MQLSTNTSLKAFIQDHLIVDITKSEVTKIVEVKRSYETAFPGRTYLVIFIGQDYYIIPSYIISSEKFFNNFGTYQNKIISYQIIPFIKPKKFLLATKPVRFSLENVGDEPVMISSPNLKTLRIVLSICFIATCILVYWISDELFILILLLTIICFTILYMQKSVFITKTHLIIRHWGRELTIPHKDIESVTEINFYKIFGDSYESALKIKYLRYSYEKQSVVFYPKDNVLNELKKILDTEYLKYFKPWSEYFDFLKKNNDLK